MEKLNYSTLNTKTNNEVNKFVFNEKEIEVLKYLPVSEKIDIVTNVLNNSQSENNFANASLNAKRSFGTESRLFLKLSISSLCFLSISFM